MAQIFHRSMNTISKATIFGALFLVAVLGAAGFAYVRSPYVTGQGVNVEQPVQFSHKHHVQDYGFDCRYCHTSVETSSFAGIPPTETCMNCHAQVWVQSQYLAPVRESWRTGQPLQWNRVNNVGDFVYFNHSIHVNKGFGCETCHGDIDNMPYVYKAATMQMEWCMECHTNPAQYIRPKEEVFNSNYQPPANQLALGQQLVQEYNVQSLTSCSTCHR